MQTVKSALEDLMLSMDRTDAVVIMSEVLGVNRAWIAANPMRILTETEDARIDMLAAQRALGRPVAYLLNRREFYGRDFALDSSVLIPRPETETLVEAALARMAPRDTLLDLGTGSSPALAGNLLVVLSDNPLDAVSSLHPLIEAGTFRLVETPGSGKARGRRSADC